MRTMKKTLILAIAGVFLLAGNVMALGLDYFLPGDTSGLTDNGAEYFYLTDTDDPASAPMVEVSSDILSVYGYDYIFGIYESNADGTALVSRLDVLDTSSGVTSSNVIFDIAGGTATSLLGTASIGTTFGFFLEFDDSPITNEIYYSQLSMPSYGGADAFSVFYDPSGIASLDWAELAIGLGGPGSQGHALIKVDDVAPVPEPATILLLGAGLVGLGYFGRRKKLV